MMNPMLNQLMGFAMQNNPIMQMYRQVISAQNPSAMLRQLAQNNTQLQQTLDYINQNGGNAKELFYRMAQQKGRNPNSVLSQLKQ